MCYGLEGEFYDENQEEQTEQQNAAENSGGQQFLDLGENDEQPLLANADQGALPDFDLLDDTEFAEEVPVHRS